MGQGVSSQFPSAGHPQVFLQGCLFLLSPKSCKRIISTMLHVYECLSTFVVQYFAGFCDLPLHLEDSEQLSAGRYLCVCTCVLLSYMGERVNIWFIMFFGISQGGRTGKWQMLLHSLCCNCVLSLDPPYSGPSVNRPSLPWLWNRLLIHKMGVFRSAQSSF